MKLALRGGKAREKVMVVFRIKSDWLRKWRDIFLTNHKSQKIPNNPKSTIDTSLKANQNSALSLTRNLNQRKHLITVVLTLVSCWEGSWKLIWVPNTKLVSRSCASWARPGMILTSFLFQCGRSCTSEHSPSLLAAPFLAPPKIAELQLEGHRLAKTEK